MFVFEDDFPLNGEQDAGGGIDVLSPNEPGLGGFNITIFDDAGGTGDSTGQMTYDMFNMPLSNCLAGTIDPVTGHGCVPDLERSRGSGFDTESAESQIPGITGMIVTCPKYEVGRHHSIPAGGPGGRGEPVPGRYGVVATPGADRIARGEEWLQTNTLDGQKAHDSFIRVGEPSLLPGVRPGGIPRFHRLCQPDDHQWPQGRRL